MVKNLETQLVHDLVPKAIEVYKAKLEQGDVKVAQDVLSKLTGMGERYDGREAQREQATLEGYLKSKSYNRPAPPRRAERGDPKPEPAIDGTVVRTELLPAAVGTDQPQDSQAPAAPTTGGTNDGFAGFEDIAPRLAEGDGEDDV
jgi:hypothetical protein